MPILQIPIDRIVPNAYQRRADHEYGDIETLARQIAAARTTYPATGGLMQLPMGRLWLGEKLAPANYYSQPLADWPDSYAIELAYGHRRARAWQWLVMNDPAYADKGLPVDLRMQTDREMLAAVWRENEQRENVSDFTRASLIEELITLNDWTQQQAADHLGMSRPTVANLLRLLRFPDQLRQRLTAAGISQRQALALLPIYEIDPTYYMIDAVIANPENYNAAIIRQRAETLTNKPAPKPQPPAPDPADLLDAPELEITDCPQCGSELDHYEWLGPARLINNLSCDNCGYHAEYEMRQDRVWRLVHQTLTDNPIHVDHYTIDEDNITDVLAELDRQDQELTNRTNGNGLTYQPAPVITIHPDTINHVDKIKKAMIDPYDTNLVIDYCQYMSQHQDEPAASRKLFGAIVELLECLRANIKQEPVL